MTPDDIIRLPFFWSARRHRYWNQCKRRYFLHYYAARLGRRDDPDPLCREAFALDRRVSAQELIRIILCRSMYEMFRSSEHGSVAADAVMRFRKEINNMLLYPDTAPMLLHELADSTAQVKQISDQIADDLRRAGEKIDESFWKKIDLIPSGDRRYVMRPQRVGFLELDCYFVPVLALSRHGEIWILESSSIGDQGDLISCLHRMWVANDLGRDPAKVRSLYLNEQFELKQLDDLPSVSASLNMIRTDIHAMQEAEMQGYISAKDFPPSRGEHCSFCQYQTICSKNQFIPE